MKSLLIKRRNALRIASFLLVACMSLTLLVSCNPTQTGDVSSSSNSSSQGSSSAESGSSTSSGNVSEELTSSEPYDVDSDVEENVDESENELMVQDLRVQNAGAPKSDKFMGGGTGVYSCFTYLKDALGRNYTDEMAQIEFNRLQNMGIKRVRSMFKFLWAWDSNKNTWDWDSDDMKAVYRWMSEMKKRDIDVMINPWSFDYLVNGSQSIPDAPYLYVKDNFPESCNRFSSAVSELFRQLKARGLTNAKYLVLFTEPCPAYLDPQRQGKDLDKYIQIAKSVDAKLRLDGMRKDVTIIGPNQANDSNTSLLDKCLKEAEQCFDIFSTHRYITCTNLVTDAYVDNTIMNWTPLLDAMRNAGNKKSFWIDEYNVRDYTWQAKGYSNIGFNDPWRGTQQAAVFSAGMNLGIDNMSLWTLADQLWTNQTNSGNDSGFYSGELRHGLFPSLFVSTIPKAQYYSYSLMSKYFGNGGKTYYSSSVEEYVGVYISACQTNEGNWTVMVVNCNYEPVKVNVKFDKALQSVKMFRHRYEPETLKPSTQASLIDADKTYHNVKTGFSDLIKAGGVSVYTTIKG